MPIFNTKLSTVENNIDYHLKDINWDGQSFGYSLLMINDQERNQFYRDALGDVTDRVVLDIGSGTGLLSVIAVQQGAKKVYAFEYNRRNYELAKSFIENAGLSDRIELVCANILQVDKTVWQHLDIDVVVTETFANDCFIENFAFLVEHVEKNFNLSNNCRWIPDNITLNLALVDVPVVDEFDPGVDIPQAFVDQINQSVRIYRDSLYHKNEPVNMSVAQIARIKPQSAVEIDSFFVDRYLRQHIDHAQYTVNFDHSKIKNPYIKVEWVIYSGDVSLALNQVVSWRSIAFKVDAAQGFSFYFRFNPHSHALIGTQL